MEIDESKFEKSTYHQDKRVDGVWVSGGIKRKIKKCFFINEDRSSDTLIPNIKKMYNTRHHFSVGGPILLSKVRDTNILRLTIQSILKTQTLTHNYTRINLESSTEISTQKWNCTICL